MSLESATSSENLNMAIDPAPQSQVCFAAEPEKATSQSSSSMISDINSSAAFLEDNLKVLLEDIDAQITVNQS
eukprot:Pgem_evm1s14378